MHFLKTKIKLIEWRQSQSAIEIRVCVCDACDVARKHVVYFHDAKSYQNVNKTLTTTEISITNLPIERRLMWLVYALDATPVVDKTESSFYINSSDTTNRSSREIQSISITIQ